MTAITPACAHTYQVTCLTRHMSAVPRHKFRLLLPRRDIRISPTLVPQHVKEAMTFRDALSSLMGCTRLADGETLAGWGAVARSLHGRIDIMFGPVITTEAHLALVPESTPTTPLKCRPWLRPSPFLDPMVQLPVMRTRVSFMTPNMLPVFAQARFRPHACTAAERQHRPRFTMQHVYGHTGNLGHECADHAAALGSLGLVSSHTLSTRWAHHSFDSASLHALLPATTLAMSWRNCVTLAQRWSRLPNTKTAVSALCLVRFSMVRTHTLHRM